MNFTSDLSGGTQALQTMGHLVEANQMKTRDAVRHILAQMRDYAKHNAPFMDRTGNLRNSIQYEMDADPAPSGTLYAGMDYAIHVEMRDGYWVLRGAIDHFEPIVTGIFGDKIRFTRREVE